MSGALNRLYSLSRSVLITATGFKNMLSRSGHEKRFKDVKIPMSQAERIIEKFGGVPALVKALAIAGRPRHRANVHRWKTPKEKGGTGGVIPTSALLDVAEAARLEGVLLTTEDFDPRVKYKNQRIYLEEEIIAGE